MTSARTALLTLLEQRQKGASVCPSEVARQIGGKEWRDRMPAVHATVDDLLGEGRIVLSWKGEPMPRRNGPYRITAAEE